jgi:RND family efflux transporter MFP subunit
MRVLRITLLAIVLLTISGCSLLPPEEEYDVPALEDPPPSRAVLHSVEVGDIADKIKSLGRVSPALENTLYFTRSGTIKSMKNIPNQRVKKGDILAQLEMGDKEHSLQMSAISLQESKLRLDYEEQLAAIEGRSDSVDMQIRRLSYSRAEADFNYLKEQLEGGIIRAPYDGIISNILKQAGNSVKEYEAVLRIQNPSELEVTVELTNEDDFTRITLGMPVRVEISKGRWVGAFITQIPSYSERNALGPEKDNRVRIRFANPDVYQPVMNAMFSVEIIVHEEKDAMLVPKACLHEFMGRSYVRVLDGETRREVDVEVGIRTDPLKTQILAGLEPGMQMICR